MVENDGVMEVMEVPRDGWIRVGRSAVGRWSGGATACVELVGWWTWVRRKRRRP